MADTAPADRPSLLADRQPGACLSDCDLQDAVERIADQWVLKPGVERLLLLPPDHTRLHSQAGKITARLYEALGDRVAVDVMPALGTHHPMKPHQLRMMFGDTVPLDRFLPHDWRNDLSPVGVIPGERLAELSGGRMTDAVEVAVNRRIVSGEHDLVLSIGQVVPHEVIGFANHSKNVCIGAGGGAMLHQSHFLGAVCGIENVLGVADTPVRRLVDEGFYDHVRPRADVRFVLTVVEDTQQGPALSAVAAGEGKACFTWAAAIAAEKNITRVDRPIERAVVWLDPEEFTSTWLGNKAIYRTRKAMADGGELIVLAPAVDTFGEDAQIDRLIRKHGYRGTPATLAALEADAELKTNLSAAAHLIHGSTEGRFRVTYATGSGLSREEVTGAGYDWADHDQAVAAFKITPETRDGWHDADDGRPFYFVKNPALGLWTA
ncbi:lactate racemase domain-containing protein [Botrimarina sp.]|uniref:lactate racemase domain-containing protein n=1 Tax=Botrimarina sp. TaxID=2795802 RepID=UPI0032EBF3A1